MNASPGSRPSIAAVLVVRDEAGALPGCLASLVGVVDEIGVHDTGSADATRQIALAAGATVHEGYWDDDFARARNVALELARAPWVLVLDADERVQADPEGLRALMAESTADVLVAQVHNVYPEEFGGSYWSPGYRLLRREAVRYHGRVHELPRPLRPRPRSVQDCPPAVLHVEHLGYGDPAVVRLKAHRNAAIARSALDQLVVAPAPDPLEQAKLWLDLGRSLVICGGGTEAVEAFEAARQAAPNSRAAVEGTDALARLLLGQGHDQAVLGLVEQLRQAGADSRYCDWLAAQALTQLGRAEEALPLLRGVDVLCDPAGRHLDLGQVFEVRALVAELCGQHEEALRCLATAMAGHGRVTGRGQLLLDLWGAGPIEGLIRLLASAGEGLVAGADELARCPLPGPRAAAALAREVDQSAVVAGPSRFAASLP